MTAAPDPERSSGKLRCATRHYQLCRVDQRKNRVIPLRQPSWLRRQQVDLQRRAGFFGTHSLRRTKAALIYLGTGNPRALQRYVQASLENEEWR
jgi:hypothetical protein